MTGDEMDRAYSMQGEIINPYKILDEKFEIKKPLGMHRCAWENNIKIDRKEVL
jgi:hypothetical protein